MEGQVRGCTHGHRPTTCWDCTSIIEQLHSRRVWEDLQQVPGFDISIEQMEREVQAGQTIRLKRADYGEKRILISFSALWEIVDLLMADEGDEDDD